jgi:hypothetical protein
MKKLEISILSCIRRKARTKKTIARIVGLDILVLSPLVTDLILKGHL